MAEVVLEGRRYREVVVDDGLTMLEPIDPAPQRPAIGTIRHVGIGGRARVIDADMELGVGVWRTEREGFRRALWDAAYGYVSGFRGRDIAYFVVTRSFSRRLFYRVVRWERSRARERGEIV
jgi:hypothetical protein